VLEVDSVEYNSEWYRRVRLGESDSQTTPFFWDGYFDERTFGRNIFYPEYNSCESIIEWAHMSFICYRDDELLIPNSYGPCGVALSTDITSSNHLKVFPNPITRGRFSQDIFRKYFQKRVGETKT
jgi:hypothetical protein